MNNLKKIRKEKGIKQSTLAEVVGVDQGTFSRFENGDRRIDSDILIRLSEYLDLSIDYILGNTDVPLTLAEIRFNKEIDHMSDEEVFDSYNLSIDGEPITKEEAKKILDVIRTIGK